MKEVVETTPFDTRPWPTASVRLGQALYIYRSAIFSSNSVGNLTERSFLQPAANSFNFGKMAEPVLESNLPRWKHPGGKLVELGAEKLTDAELLAIIIGTWVKVQSAEKVW